MSKEIALTEDEALQEWKRRNVTERTKLNQIKIDNNRFNEDETKNENFGKITATSYSGEEETEKKVKVGDSFFPIRVMVAPKTKVFEEIDGKSKPKYICKEVERFTDIEVVDFASKEVVFSGLYRDAKEEYGLRYRLALYVLLDGVIYRWEIGGGDTLGSWFDAERVINDIGCPHSVKVKEVIPQKNNTIYWNDIKFMVGDKFPVQEALKLDDMLWKKKKDVVTYEDSFEELGEPSTNTPEATGPRQTHETPPSRELPLSDTKTFSDEDLPDFLN